MPKGSESRTSDGAVYSPDAAKGHQLGSMDTMNGWFGSAKGSAADLTDEITE